MSLALIIGYGNPLRSDDGLGWRAAQDLAQFHGTNGVHVLACHQLTPELAEAISHVDSVAFIDASRSDSPGTIVEKSLHAEPTGPVVWNHVMNPLALLSYAKHLYSASPNATVFSIGGQFFGFGEALSPAVARALPRLVGRIREWIQHPESISEQEVHEHA